MAESEDFTQSRENASSVRVGGDSTEQRQVQVLTWALLDEVITADEKALLDQLLYDSATARDTYLHCVRLHADLSGHFAPAATPAIKTAVATPSVLGFLEVGVLPLELQGSPVEQSPS